jgi:hypothetical protein
MEEAMRKVTGILIHPAFSDTRADVVITPGPNRTVTINGPKNHLDGFTPALRTCGLTLSRPAPATLVIAF